MKRAIQSTVFFVLAMGLTAPAIAGKPTRFLKGQMKVVRGLIGQKVVKGTPEAKAHDEKLKVVIDPLMEFDKLSERSLRKHWPTLSPDQKAEFILLFRELVFQSYLSKVRSANEDYSIVYEDEEAKGRKAAAVTAIAKTRKAEIELVFHLVARSAKVWVAEDIVIDEVSLVENYREQFNKIIAEDGFAALLTKMRKKLTKLGATIPTSLPASTPSKAPASVPSKAAPAKP